MMVRLALIDETGERASLLRIAPRLKDARFTVVADTVHAALQQADSFDAIVHLTNRFPGDSLAQQIAASGKHWLCDGPLAKSASTARQLAERFGGDKPRLMTGPAARFLPSNRAVKESIDSGKLGEPGLVRIHRWMSNVAAGSLVDLVYADVDLACWIVGSRLTTILARGDASSIESRAPDYMQLHLGFAGDRMAMIDVASSLPRGDNYYTLSVIGSTGAAYADDHHNMQLLYKGGHPAAIMTEQGDRQRLGQLQEFLNAIREQREPSPGVNDLAATLETIEAAAESLKTGRAVTFARQSTGSEVRR